MFFQRRKILVYYLRNYLVQVISDQDVQATS
jgi:hypothetical protein